MKVEREVGTRKSEEMLAQFSYQDPSFSLALSSRPSQMISFADHLARGVTCCFLDVGKQQVPRLRRSSAKGRSSSLGMTG
jgi:hypothetical protein